MKSRTLLILILVTTAILAAWYYVAGPHPAPHVIVDPDTPTPGVGPVEGPPAPGTSSGSPDTTVKDKDGHIVGPGY